ncbi:MAG: 50S ribosome-binding GTPase [Magnetococcus sp. YQC-3]
MATPFVVALVGNPNAGTTTLFNALTGAQGSVANYARVTTEVAMRDITHRGVVLRIVDVPGLHSTTSRSPEDRAGCDYLHGQAPDLVVNVLDAGRLDRNLFLTTQLIESGLKYLLVLNMVCAASDGM